MAQAPDATRRRRVTRPYPTYTLEDALSVAEAIYEVNAGLPFDRELLAGALGTTPKSSAFTMRLNASRGLRSHGRRIQRPGHTADRLGRDGCRLNQGWRA